MFSIKQPIPMSPSWSVCLLVCPNLQSECCLTMIAITLSACKVLCFSSLIFPFVNDVPVEVMGESFCVAKKEELVSGNAGNLHPLEVIPRVFQCIFSVF